jgi:hypothetical protein
VLTGIGMTACVAPLTTVVLDAAPCDLGGSASGLNNAAARLGGLVAVAALGFAFGGTSASDVASVAVVETYRRVMWTAALSGQRRRRRTRPRNLVQAFGRSGTYQRTNATTFSAGISQGRKESSPDLSR